MSDSQQIIIAAAVAVGSAYATAFATQETAWKDINLGVLLSANSISAAGAAALAWAAMGPMKSSLPEMLKNSYIVGGIAGVGTVTVANFMGISGVARSAAGSK